MSSVSRKPDLKNMAELIEAQWNSFIESYSTGINTQYETTDEYHRLVTETPIPMLNGYTSINLRSSEEAISRLARYFQDKNQHFSWCIGPSTAPSNLSEVLEDKGYRKGMQMPGMAIKLEESVSETKLEDLEVRLAQSNSDLQTFFKVLVVSGWGMGEDFVGRFTELQINDQTRCDRVVHRYLGYFDGEPVATGQLVYEHGVAGLYNICTLAEFRRKGIGSAFTCMLMNRARADNYDWCVLHASSRGKPIYEKIGFETFCYMRYYDWTPN